METLQESASTSELQRGPDPVGPRISIAREHAGMTAGELAAHLGVASSTIAAWESGRRVPRANRLHMLAGILNVSLTWLLEGREDQRMARGGAASIDDVRSRLQAARAQFCEALAMLESAEDALSALAGQEEDVDPSEVED